MTVSGPKRLLVSTSTQIVIDIAPFFFNFRDSELQAHHFRGSTL